MKNVSYIILLYILVSCAVTNDLTTISDNKNDTKQKVISTKEIETTAIVIPKHNVQILIRQRIPYCGGAYPSDDQLNNSTAYSGAIVLINQNDSTRTVISSLQNGGYYLNLVPGNYSIQESYKNVPYHEFRSAMNMDHGQHIISGGEECYMQWWKSTLHDFVVSDAAEILTINCSISSSCYTGINPCAYYNGPLPN